MRFLAELTLKALNNESLKSLIPTEQALTHKDSSTYASLNKRINVFLWIITEYSIIALCFIIFRPLMVVTQEKQKHFQNFSLSTR